MKSYPYDSIPTTDENGNVTYDRYVTAATERALTKALFTDGILPNPELGGEVVVSTNMTVTISPIFCFANGLKCIEENETEWTFDDSDTKPRIDRLVVRGDISTEVRDAFFYIIKGTPADTPVVPDRLTGTMISDIVLADVYIPANSTAISQTNITDQRLNSELCGIVTQMVNTIDTTTLFNQLQTQVDDNIALIQSAIDGTAQGILQGQIDENATNIDSIATVVSNNVNNIAVNAEEITDIKSGTIPVGNATKFSGLSSDEFLYGVNKSGMSFIVSETEVNAIRKAGFYYIDRYNSNMPTQGYYYLIHLQESNLNNYAIQYAVNINESDNMVYSRKLYNNVWSGWTMISSGHKQGEAVKLYQNNSFDGLENISIGDFTEYSSLMFYYNDNVSTSAGGVITPTIIPTNLLLSGAIPKFSCFVYNNQVTEAIYTLTIQYFTSTNKFLVTGVQGSNVTIYGIY